MNANDFLYSLANPGRHYPDVDPDLEWNFDALMRRGKVNLGGVSMRLNVTRWMGITCTRSMSNDKDHWGKSMYDERLELLLAISRETLGIENFESTGQDALDVRMVSVEEVGRALESAYDAGLVVGYRVARSECTEGA